MSSPVSRAGRGQRLPGAFFYLALTGLLLFPLMARAAHHHASASSHAQARTAKKAQQTHLARLAAQEKAAWRAHLAKLRELPRHQRIAMKRHDRKFKKQEDRAHDARLAAQQAHLARLAQKQAHLARLAQKQAHLARLAAQSRAHETRVAKLVRRAHPRHAVVAKAIPHPARHMVKMAQKHVRHPVIVVQKIVHRPVVTAQRTEHHPVVKPHATVPPLPVTAQKNLPPVPAAPPSSLRPMPVTGLRPMPAQPKPMTHAEAQHASRLTAHNARLARAQAVHLAKLRAYQQRVAQSALAHQTRAAKAQSAHNAHLAAQHAHWIALHGDGSGGRSIHFWQTVAAGIPVKVITVDLNDHDVKVSAVMARRGTGTAEPFRQMIDRANPNVAVTGTFFSLDNLRPIGDIVIDGSLVHFGGMGTALCITPSNRADMVTTEWGRHHDWTGYDFVCACGPRLLRRGRVVLDPSSERFRDRHMLAPNSRIAVGITQGNKIVFVMTHEPIYLGRLAKVMQAVGVSEAMNLDAGTSTGFYYNGATLARPGRQLTNMIVVYGRKSRYERALDQLVPAAYRHSEAGSVLHRQVSLAAGR